VKCQGRVERNGLGEKVGVCQRRTDWGLDEVGVRLDDRERHGRQRSRCVGRSDLRGKVGRDGSGELPQLWFVSGRHGGVGLEGEAEAEDPVC